MAGSPRYTPVLAIFWLANTAAFQHQSHAPIISRTPWSCSRDGVLRLLPITTALHAVEEEEEEGSPTTESPTAFTLSFGDVEFCLTPDTANAATDVMSISKINNGEVSIDLNNFSGTLHVKDPNAIIEDDSDSEDNTSIEVKVVDPPPPPPPPQPETKKGKRFNAMLADFRLHSEADINLVKSARYRGLLTGTSAAINDPKVTLAFKVLYEDIGPVRVAGDLIFSKLERELAKSKVTTGAVTVQALGRDDSCVVAARKVFDAVDADASGTVSSQELLESDLLGSLGGCSDSESVMRFMDEIDKTHPEGELHFDEFLLASHNVLYAGDASVSLFGGDSCAEELVDEMLNGREGEIGQEKVDRYAKRFDNMCDEFDSWDSDESTASSKAEKNPRMGLVLEGCFAGSKNPPVVDALKILYIDFRPLRMAGDLIFKMMRKLAT